MSLRPAVSLYQQRGSVLVTAPGSEPVTATELRTHLRTDSTELPDAEANALIADARSEIENMIGLAFISQSWRLSIDRWPAGGEAWWDGTLPQQHIAVGYSASLAACLDHLDHDL